MCNRLHIGSVVILNLATIREVALRANVSVATVSRVINNKGYVDPNTREIVLKAIDELNYVPNSVAQVLAGKKMKVIALIVPDISNPFFAELAKAVEDTAQQRGFTLFLCNSDEEKEKENRYIDVLKSKSIDGIIFATHHFDESMLDLCQDIPIVLMDRAMIQQPNDDLSILTSQNRKGVQLAIRHLLERGCRKIAHIYGPQQIITARERRIGYQEAVSSFPWYTDSLMEPGYFQMEGGRQAIRRLMERHPDLDGVFVGNDTMAIGALKELHRMKIDVPEQVAICGFDGIHMAKVMEPELTTVAQPIEEMGKKACQLLIDKIEGKAKPKQIIRFDVKLIVRGSTKRR